ncbi:MAG: GAF domain-containing protein [Ardenticatenaceae bacterium]|nr:GAF domain-containing protein [Ardenticatenaceae bacterium]
MDASSPAGPLHVETEALRTELARVREQLARQMIEKQFLEAALTAMVEPPAATVDVNAVAAETLEYVLNAVHVDIGAIYLGGEASNSLRLVAARGLDSLGKAALVAVQAIEQLSTVVLAEGRPILVSAASGDDERLSGLAALGIQSLAAAPLVAKGSVRGTLGIASRSPRRLGDDDLRFFERLTRQAGIAIANASLYHDLQQAYQELQSAQERLIEAERQKVAIQMAGAAAHELNQPLTVIIGYTSILLQRSDQSDPNYPMLAILERNARKISEIVKRLSQITRYKTRDYAHDDTILDLRPESPE